MSALPEAVQAVIAELGDPWPGTTRKEWKAYLDQFHAKLVERLTGRSK